MVSLIPAILGIYGLTRMEVRALPRFDIPLVQISTVLVGASPEEVDSRITTPIEQAIATVGDIDTIVSRSDAGLSSIDVTFRFGTDSVEAANGIQAAIEQLGARLPRDAERPTVTRLSLDALPVIYLSLASDIWSDVEISDIASRLLVPQLATLPGVSSVQLTGDRSTVMWVTLRPYDLAAAGIAVDDVAAAVRGRNTSVPAGEVTTGGFRTSLGLSGAVDPVEEIRNVTLRQQDGYQLRLGDLADVEIGGSESTTRVLVSGRPGIALGVSRQPSANELEVAAAVRDALPRLRALLPAGISLDVAFDSTAPVQASLIEVRDTLLMAVGLVVLIVFLFLASLRSAIITMVTIPLSLLSAIVFMYAVGFSFNTFTLLAFVLAIGLVVDDAIVDVENVQRHIDEGLSPVDAAFVGSAEIGFAIVATTLTLASLYLPIGLAPGLVGSLFREFGLTLAVAVIASGVISRTLSPMMCSRLLRPGRASAYARAVDRLFDRLAAGYRWLLERILHARPAAGLLAVAVIALGAFAAPSLQTEMSPVEDQGYILLQMTGPTNATADYLLAQGKAAAELFERQPEKASSLVLFGIPARNQGYAFLSLVDWKKRSRSAQEIAAALKPELDRIPGLSIAIIPTSALGGDQGKPLQVVIKGAVPYQQLAAAAARVVEAARGSRAIADPDINLSFDLPRLQLEVARAAADDLGVSLDRIAGILRMLFGGYEIDRFTWQGGLYQIMARASTEADPTPDRIAAIPVRDAAGDFVPLDTFVRVSETVGPNFLPRFAGLPAVTISANPAPGVSTGTGLKALAELVQRELEPGMALDYAGSARQLQEASAANGLIFLLGFVFLMLTLAAQFESLRDPFIVLLVVPCSIAGAIVALALFGGSLNVFTGIGFVTLVGLVAKHGILITEFANQLRDRGLELRAAVCEAAALRLRPILMTTLAMILGSVPLVLASGAGANSRIDIGLVIVGGLIVGTLLALFVVPVAYTLITRRQRRPLVAISREALARLEASEMAHRPAE